MVGGGEQPVLILKLGGRVLEDPTTLHQIAGELSLRQTPAVIVHGGGADVDRWCHKLKLPIRTVDGLRVTDGPTLEVVTSVLAGLVNKRTVAQLRAAGLEAVGLSALDGGICEVAPSPQTDLLGHVGEIRAVRPSLIASLLEQRKTPVIASIGACGGRLLNVNADDVASAIAVAMPHGSLVVLSDVPGLVVGGNVVPRVSCGRIDALLGSPEVTLGMRAKLRAIRRALLGGVDGVVVTCWTGPGTLQEAVSGEGSGTCFVNEGAGLPAVPQAGEGSHV